MASSHIIPFVVALLLMYSELWIGQSSGMSAKEFFDQVEVNLGQVATKVGENDRNQCALLSSCGAVNNANCSRQDCVYDIADIPNYSCQAVYNNKYCEGKCNWRNYNYKKSYISISPTTDVSSHETTMVICAQRTLDEVFPTVTNPTNNTPVYFASVDGTSRKYPGRDEFPCKYFDPRIRPWYMAALYVKKVVIVAIDTGNTMGQPMLVGDDKSQNPLATAKSLTMALMDTLSGSDFINIMVYDASTATLLAPKPVPVNDSHSDTYPPNHTEFADLTTKLMNTAVGAPNAGPSNLSLDTAISNMSSFGSEFVKIVIVLTDGVLATNSTSPMWKSLKEAGVKLFVYKFETSAGVEVSTTSDQQQVCSIGGSYESFAMNRRQNSLFALQSIYSFVANVRTKMNSSIVYGYVYDDYGQADSKVFTMSQTVYDSNGVLLGVVGIDIHRSDVRARLNITDADFEAETKGRHIVYTFNATRDLLLDSTTCTNQTTAITNGGQHSNCGSEIPIPTSGGLCVANDDGSRNIAQFSCCQDCVAIVKPTIMRTIKKWLIIICPILGVVCIGVAACFLYKWFMRWLEKRKERRERMKEEMREADRRRTEERREADRRARLIEQFEANRQVTRAAWMTRDRQVKQKARMEIEQQTYKGPNQQIDEQGGKQIDEDRQKISNIQMEYRHEY